MAPLIPRGAEYKVIRPTTAEDYRTKVALYIYV